jgi:hypothetical protein
MERVNKKGRTYVKGCAMGNELRTLIIDNIILAGGCIETSYFPGDFNTVQAK